MPTSLTRLRRTQPPRVLIYARVSKDQREGRSVAQQLTIGRRVAAESEWDIVGEYSDNDQSASQYARGAREEWQQVEDRIRAGEVDILWLWELSRGTRDRVVWAHLVDACQNHRMYIALDEDLWDTTSPDHMAYLDTEMTRSIQESGKTHKRIMRDIAAGAAEGRPHSHAHAAYDREYDPRTGQLIRQVPNPEWAERCRQIAQWLVAERWTPSVIAAHLNRQGVRTPFGRVLGERWVTRRGRKMVSHGWTRSTVDQLMSSPTLMGKRGYNGQIVDAGGWEAVLDEETWHAVQKMLGHRGYARKASGPSLGPPRPGAAEYLASAIMVCDVCGAPTYVKRARHRKSMTYYCAGLGPGGPMHGTRLVTTVDHAIETLAMEWLAHPDVRAALVPEKDSAKVVRARARVGELEGELEGLYADVEAGRVSRRMAQADEARLVEALESAQRETVPQMVDPLALELASGDPRTVWTGWGLEQRRAALQLLAEEIRMLPVGGGRKTRPPEEHVRIVWRGMS